MQQKHIYRDKNLQVKVSLVPQKGHHENQLLVGYFVIIVFWKRKSGVQSPKHTWTHFSLLH